MNPIDIGCPFCGKKYQIDGKKIKEKRVRVKCKACGHFITVEKPAGSVEKAPSPSAPGAPRVNSGSDAPAPSGAVSHPEPADGDKAPPRADENAIEEDDWPPFQPGEGDDSPGGADGLFFEEDEGRFVTGDESPRPPGEEEFISEPVFKDETSETDLIPKAEKIGLFNRLQFRIGAVLLLLTAMVPAGFAAYAHHTTSNRIARELNGSARGAANRLAMQLERPLLNGEKASAGGSIRAEMLDKNIYAVVVRGRDGKSVFSAMRRDATWKAIPTSGPVRGDYIHSRKDVFDHEKNEKLGSVEVFVAKKFQEEALNGLMLNIVVMTLVLIALMMGALSLLLRKMVIRPINKLTHNAEMMCLGDLHVDIDVKSKNEIGSLAQAMDRMQGSLRGALKRMRRRM